MFFQSTIVPPLSPEVKIPQIFISETGTQTTVIYTFESNKSPTQDITLVFEHTNESGAQVQVPVTFPAGQTTFTQTFVYEKLAQLRTIWFYLRPGTGYTVGSPNQGNIGVLAKETPTVYIDRGTATSVETSTQTTVTWNIRSTTTLNFRTGVLVGVTGENGVVSQMTAYIEAGSSLGTLSTVHNRKPAPNSYAVVAKIAANQAYVIDSTRTNEDSKVIRYQGL